MRECERKKRKDAVKGLAPVGSQPQPTNGGPVDALSNPCRP
jgi:hypothetical protein